MRHLDEGTIHAWLDGGLDAATEAKAEAHAARCTECAVAVADARGLIAASSRILTALDDVPAGVLPRGSRASARTYAPPRQWATRTMRIAASLAVVVTGAAIAMRSGVLDRARLTVASKDSERKEVLSAPAAALPASSDPAESQNASPPPTGASGGVSAGAPLAAPAVPPEQRERALATDERGQMQDQAKRGEPQFAHHDTIIDFQGALKQNAAPANAMAGKPAVLPASGASGLASGAADKLASSETDTASMRQLASDVAAKAPKVKLESAPAAAGAVGNARGLEMSRATTAPGMRLVSEQQATESARLVQRRVYEVRPGVEVTLAILGPAPAAPAAPAKSRADADMPARDSADSASRRPFRSHALNEEAAGINSIQWTDSTGFEFTLSGPLPLDSLRALRPLLPKRAQRR